MKKYDNNGNEIRETSSLSPKGIYGVDTSMTIAIVGIFLFLAVCFYQIQPIHDFVTNAYYFAVGTKDALLYASFNPEYEYKFGDRVYVSPTGGGVSIVPIDGGEQLGGDNTIRATVPTIPRTLPPPPEGIDDTKPQ
jgi:hypothetical protein